MSERPAADGVAVNLPTVDERILGRECRVFTRCLVGGQPDEYIITRYVAAHRARPEFYVGTPFDDVVLSLARQASLGTRIADAHSRIFAPTALLRRKLVLLLAILETSAPFAGHIDDPGSGSRITLPLRLAGRGLVAALSLLAGTLLLLPARLARPHREKSR